MLVTGGNVDHNETGSRKPADLPARPCAKCGQPVRPEDANCSSCGTANHGFDSGRFVLKNGKTIMEVLQEKCLTGHQSVRGMRGENGKLCQNNAFCDVCGQKII